MGAPAQPTPSGAGAYPRHLGPLLVAFADPAFLLSDRLKCIDSNGAARALTGLGDKDLLERSLFDLLISHDQAALERLIDSVRSADHHTVFEGAVKGANGLSAHPVEVRLQYFPEYQIFLALILDTAQRRREARAQTLLLAQSEAAETLFRSFIELAPDAVVVTNDKHDIQLVNRQTEQLFGYGRDEFTGKSLKALLPDTVFPEGGDWMPAADGLPEVRRLAFDLGLRAVRKDGSTFPVEVLQAPIRSPQGILLMSVVRDMSVIESAQNALKRQSEELSRSNAELERFAYIASHDLQEPLRMVGSYTQLLARRYQDKLDKDANDFIHYAVDGAKRMQQLIDDLLAYSRVSRAGQPFKTCELERVFGRARENLEFAIREAKAEITSEALPVIRGDESQLIQVFQNLIGNAIKFRRVDARLHVHVGARCADGEWVLSIADNGIGIDPRYNEKIFVIFQRLHGKQDFPGTGIGLAICRRIIERHGGRIWVEPQKQQGSIFYFTLPIPRETTA